MKGNSHLMDIAVSNVVFCMTLLIECVCLYHKLFVVEYLERFYVHMMLLVI